MDAAYKYMISDKLPNVNYMTMLESYSYFSFAFIFFVVLENMIIKVLDFRLTSY